MLKLVICLVVAAQSAVLFSKQSTDDTVIPITPQLDGRIVGGRDCSIVKHPHQISLRYRNCNACAYAHLCGGSIFNKNTIVTAAHCVYGRTTENFIVVAGTENRNGADGVLARVESVVIHENYNSVLTDNDVAVLFLSTPLPLNDLTIAAIPLADVHPDHGVMSHVTGWGTTSPGGSASAKLQEVEVPIVDNVECRKSYGEGRISDSMLCAGYPKGGKDACQGDSGGPLVVAGELAGIVSWGRSCALEGYPGVYASVAFLKNWILDAVSKKF